MPHAYVEFEAFLLLVGNPRARIWKMLLLWFNNQDNQLVLWTKTFMRRRRTGRRRMEKHNYGSKDDGRNKERVPTSIIEV
jgi:hypothetical protein